MNTVRNWRRRKQKETQQKLRIACSRLIVGIQGSSFMIYQRLAKLEKIR